MHGELAPTELPDFPEITIGTIKKAHLKREKKHFPSVPTEINKSEPLFYQSDVKCRTESADK